MHDLTAEERALLVALLDRREAELLHELHHADARRFKEGLREELALVERLKDRFREPVPA
jgi:hypothetical protein